MALELKKPDISMKESLDNFIENWGVENIIPSTFGKYNGDMKEFLDYLDIMEKDPPRLLVPSSMWFLCDGREILGAVEVRHFLNDGLKKYGGHIGYGVAPKHRGNGFRAKMLEMLTDELKKLKLPMVSICCLEENIASAKTIEKSGGRLEATVELIRGGQPKTGLRYILEIK